MCLVSGMLEELFKPVNINDIEGFERELLDYLMTNDNNKAKSINRIFEDFGNKSKVRKTISKLRSKGFIVWALIESRTYYLVNPYIEFND